MIVLSIDASHEILGNGQKGFAKDFGVRFLRGPDEQQRLMGMIIMRAILSYAFMREQQIQNVKAMLEPTLQVTASEVYFEVIFYMIRATEEENRVITISYGAFYNTLLLMSAGALGIDEHQSKLFIKVLILAIPALTMEENLNFKD